jgi:hypothetical protein
MGTGLPQLRTALLAILAMALALLAGIPFAASAGLVPNPANDPLLVDEPIEDYRYDHADHCVKRAQPGARALVRWLDANVRGESWGIVRCEKLAPNDHSVHAEGRAVDWHLDARKPQERRAAMGLIDALLAPDHNGNPHALARRMGIQGIIFDCRSWWSGMDGLGEYSVCEDNGDVDPTQAHKDHIHLELNWPGARKETSFWRSPLAG